MANKAKVKRKISVGNKSISFDANLFPSAEFIAYSGFGAHVDKNRRESRRTRRLEEKRVQRGD